MTAQVAILNKQAVVLASDSASTVSNRDYTKIFNAKEKIFKLRDNLPVAMMISNSASYLDIPLSIVIEMFRNHIKEKRFSTLNEYMICFQKFLEESKNLTTYDRHYYFFYKFFKRQIDLLSSEYERINRDDEGFKKWLVAKTKEISEFHAEYFSEEHNPIIYKAFEEITTYSGSVVNSGNISQFIKKFKKEIIDYLVIALRKGINNNEGTEIVFAGYGDDDIFPSISSALVIGIFNNKLKVTKTVVSSVRGETPGLNESSAFIKPFAQDEGVKLFLNGISRELEKMVKSNFRANNSTILEYISNHNSFKDLDDKEQSRLVKDLGDFTYKLNNEFKSKLSSLEHGSYTAPIVTAISFMEHSEMTELAHTLVNLTSVRKKYSIDLKETVGGEIKVVVITKEDGILMPNFRRNNI